jgi:hypothetical protein
METSQSSVRKNVGWQKIGNKNIKGDKRIKMVYNNIIWINNNQ